MHSMPEQKPSSRRHNFTLLLSKEEHAALDQLSKELGISKGAVLRCAVNNLLQTKKAGTITTPIELDTFWTMFRGG